MRIILVLALVSGCAANGPPESARVLLNQPVAALDGAHLEVTSLEVRYGPGGSSAPHRHSCAVIGYIIEGALRSQVRGGPMQVYRAGESFYEPANGVHEISANASNRKPVRFTAIFLCDHGPPHTEPVSSAPERPQ
jgi:quercetin dioxygenase-like cupin family protein